MVKIERMRAEHMEALLEQDPTKRLRDALTPDKIRALAEYPHSYAALDESRKVLGCAGVIKYWEGRAEAWAILDLHSPAKFIHIHRAVKRFLDIFPAKRIEAAVDIGFDAGHRWVRILGFELEAPLLKSYRPDGGDCSLYAKVRA